jgi:hypothetical protein
MGSGSGFNIKTNLIHFVKFLFCFDEDCLVLFNRFNEHIVLSFTPSAHLYHATFRLESYEREGKEGNIETRTSLLSCGLLRLLSNPISL